MKERKEYYVYMLRFRDGSFYTGITNSIEVRMWQYRNNIHPECYVNQKGSFELVRVETYEYIMDAISREKQIKRWSRRKKEALSNGNWHALPELSESMYAKRIRYIRNNTQAIVSSLDELGMTQDTSIHL